MGGELGLGGWMIIVCGVILLRSSKGGWVISFFFFIGANRYR